MEQLDTVTTTMTSSSPSSDRPGGGGCGSPVLVKPILPSSSFAFASLSSSWSSSVPRRLMAPQGQGQGQGHHFHQLMRTYSFHDKSDRVLDLNRLKGVTTHSGSLDGTNPDGSKKAHLSDFAAADQYGPDSLDRKTLKDTSSMSTSASKLSKRESLKEKKKTYRSQKKEVAREIMNSASDQSFVLMADWLKVRGTLKGWTKLWCQCKPGMLILYKSEKMKTGHWVGTILLSTCQLLQRPSKKEGFCFKLFHPMDQSIWATKGPKGETIGALVQPLPVSYLIFRAPSENQGKCWMDGLELALRCTSLIKRTTSRPQDMTTALTPDLSEALTSNDDPLSTLTPMPNPASEDTEDGVEELEETVEEAHYSEEDDVDDHSSIESGSDFELAEEDYYNKPVSIPRVEETPYVPDTGEELGQQGDACQTEEVNDENKSLIWTLVKQVRPGMDLSKVVLPTFILEPRSFLDKLTDYYYHADLLSQAVQQETALERMKHVVKWYLSGFYKKPKGLKKPYNPIIGETFRCCWTHPETKSRTFYVAEQISHHPPISAFHVTNRQDGFNIHGCILAKSKFYGNSISAILDGVCTLTFLERGEDYFITMPYAHCKGILLGTLTMEMGGKVTVNCPKTGYHCDLDFKLKPFFGNGESANRITGRIRMGSEVLCTFEGHWDQQIYIKELTNRERVLFWDPSPDVRAKRLVRHVVPLDKQLDNESQRLWKKVSDAVVTSDMHAATAEKHFLEEKQRSEAKERHKTKVEWVPKWFSLDAAQNKWIYKHVDGRPWDPMTDCVQYERDYVISTQTAHTVPRVWRCGSGGSSSGMAHSQHIKGYNSSQLDSDSSDANMAEISDDSVKCRNTNRAPSYSEGLTLELLQQQSQHPHHYHQHHHQHHQHQHPQIFQHRKVTKTMSYDSTSKKKVEGSPTTTPTHSEVTGGSGSGGNSNVVVHRRFFTPEHAAPLSSSTPSNRQYSMNGHSSGGGGRGVGDGTTTMSTSDNTSLHSSHNTNPTNQPQLNGESSILKLNNSSNFTPTKGGGGSHGSAGTGSGRGSPSHHSSGGGGGGASVNHHHRTSTRDKDGGSGSAGSGGGGRTLSLSHEFETIVKMAKTQQEIKSCVDELLQCVHGLRQSQLEQQQQQQQQQQQHSSGGRGLGRGVGVGGGGVGGGGSPVFSKEWILIAIVLVFQMLLQCYLSR